MFSIDSLNELQKKIALDTEGAILVSAGAGSGKTRLLTHRIVYLIEELGVNPQNILAITFTNKATNEMKERISQMTSKSNVWISTFHAMCAKILRDNIYRLDGYNKYFTIYDTSDRDKVLKRVAKNLNMQDDFHKTLDYNISIAKNEGLRPNEYGKKFSYIKDIDSIVRGYQEYEEELKRNNSLDFDDLLMKTLILLESSEATLDYYQNLFKYILVDEFQDTNTIQYKLIKLLSGKHGNIFVVGDEDQCIYGWRGANIDNIKNFIKEHEGCKVYKLEQNYRSTKNIIKGANMLIKNNSSRIDKTLFTENDNGDNIIYNQSYDESEEADFVANSIYRLHEQGVEYKDIGILMRISALSRLFEEKLLNYNIPFQVSGIFKFFERLEIKNILAYLSIIVNPKDNNSLVRIINYPKRGIGQATIDKLLDTATHNGITAIEVLENIDSYDFGSAKSKLKEFANLINQIRSSYEVNGMSDFVKDLLKIAGINDLYNTQNEEDINRKMNIDQFVNSVMSYEANNEGDGIIDYLQSVTLQNDLQDEDNDGNSVSVSTVHASKGLEFDYVYIVGAEEGSFPLSRALENEDELEEERRLMYVAVTRARKKLYITRAKSRFLYGKRNYTVESRFLKEMDLSKPEVKQYTSFGQSEYSEFGKSFGYGNTSSGGGFGTNQSVTEKFKPATFDSYINQIKTEKKEKEEVSTEMKVGALVLHPKFGTGNVTKLEKSGDNTFVMVDFKSVGIKTLSLSFAPLKVLGS